MPVVDDLTLFFEKKDTKESRLRSVKPRSTYYRKPAEEKYKTKSFELSHLAKKQEEIME